MSEANRGRVRTGTFERVLERLRHHDAGHLVVQPQREPVARQRKDADEYRDRPSAAEAVDKSIQVLEIEDDLGHRELRTCLELPLKALELDLYVVGRRIDGDAGEERCRRIDRPPVEVLAAVEV